MIKPVLICSQRPKVKHFFIGLVSNWASVFKSKFSEKNISGFVKDIQNDKLSNLLTYTSRNTIWKSLYSSGILFFFSFDKWPSDTIID
jgi:hypothetical protein